MTPEEVKSKVRAVLRLMKPEWKCVAMDKDGEWFAFTTIPRKDMTFKNWWGGNASDMRAFDLPPFPGDWRDSLVEREE